MYIYIYTTNYLKNNQHYTFCSLISAMKHFKLHTVALVFITLEQYLHLGITGSLTFFFMKLKSCGLIKIVDLPLCWMTYAIIVIKEREIQINVIINIAF